MGVFSPTGTSAAGIIQQVWLSDPDIDNVVAATAGTEYSWTVPAGTILWRIKSRLNAKLQIAFTSGESGTKYFTINPGNSYLPPSIISPGASVTVYFQSAKDADTLEAEYWM